jgi:rod shape determining protein RodA
MTATSFPTGRARRSLSSLQRNPASPWRHLDLVLVGCIVAVSVLGALMVFSATRGRNPSAVDTTLIKKQLVFLLTGGLVMVLVAAVDYRRFRDFAPGVYALVAAALLLVVSPLGASKKGSQAWFPLGPFQLQPSEFAKIVLVCTLAAVIAHWQGEIDLRRLAILLGLAGLPMALIMLQPDLGTTLVFVGITMGMFLIGGVEVRHIVALTVVGIIGVVGVLNSSYLDRYQKDRLTTFLDQGTTTEKGATIDPKAAARRYNLNQSKIAIGAGGTLGKGLFQGTQTRLDIVPEQHTDFIFTAVGEELGFIGAGTLLALFSIIAWRIWRTAQLARDQFGSLVCIGVLSMFVFQVFQNVGMTMGIMPITGIPLPFMSYGGSSTLMAFAAMGLVLNVHMRRFS